MSVIVRNCRLCQESMINSPFMLCTECLKDTEQVWNFIKKNPYVSVKDISFSTGISFEKVERMINFGKKNPTKRVIKK